MSSNSGLTRLIVHPNDYPWGKVGNDSLAGRLTKNASEPDFKFDPDQPYAELWMGTHPTNPASLYSSPSTLLSKFLQTDSNPKYLGSSKSKFQTPFTGKKGSGSEDQVQGHIPFLFKVLTCKQALPLQIHPNKDLAKKLHEQDPEKFPDVNHKPEIAVCLGASFLGFAHFRAYDQIVQFLTKVPEIESLSSDVRNTIQTFVDNPTADKLQGVWEKFLKLSDDEQVVKGFSKRVDKDGVIAFENFTGEGFSEKEKENLVKAVRSNKKYYHGDGGLFSTLFFLNLVELKKDEGIYVGADGPHAWLEGEIVELMAISDNVLNVGFTPDSDKDDPSLVAQTVTHQSKSPDQLKLTSQKFSKSTQGNSTVYKVPFEEFSILKISGDDQIKAFDGPAIAIILSGTWDISEQEAETETRAQEGSVYFIGAGTSTSWNQSEGKEGEDGGKGEVWIAFYDADAPKEEVGQK
ncbi:mannose-6-phosphate isomerase, class I [Kwoniella dejecticola CBS 10117]|uniref:Mannose-6-phosphate isomerase n=1 Tax=Kwoniella dejecticola CBS 10117 TaxID=1296121 RepID=A0A1A6ABS1_9TREE|nr:mannose-6-phosphate isomerase, class I [Kwoniella dejecticola CBS 10117]OBR87512.1 mannose-6-phosphate isomerase, class I [Kwoniella dejecticola CBS 10117]